MKNFTKILAIAFLGLAFSTNALAQSTTATASAVIVTPITIAKNVDMNFGNIVPSALAGTVVMTPLAVRTPSNVTLPAITGTVAAARFTLTGTSGLTYTVTFPAVAVPLTGAGLDMTVDSFTSTASGTLPAATEVFTVGATLHVGANQASGTYTSAPFTVTVSYN